MEKEREKRELQLKTALYDKMGKEKGDEFLKLVKAKI